MKNPHFSRWLILLIAAISCTSCKSKIAADAPAQNTDEVNPTLQIATDASSPAANAPETAQNPDAKHCLKTRECAEDEYCHLRTQRCKKKCMSHDECGIDRICRTDGRCSSKYFETVWNINAPNMTITLPFNPRNNANDGDTTRDFFITWGDGTEREHYFRGSDRDKISHTYKMPGKYHIKIEGDYYGWGRSGGEVLPLIEVVSFGNVGLTSGAFRETQLKIIPEDDVPNANSLTTLREFFYYAEEFNQPIYWDAENVGDMFDMFHGAKRFNQPIMFDTSHVNNMANMLAGAVSFNSAVNIDTSSVKFMSQMFYEAESFNQPVQFNTHNVLDFSGMFYGAKSFNQPVDFDTSNALTLAEMFTKAESFNQPINLNVPKVEMFCNMFADAIALNSPLTFINVNPDVYFIDGMMYGTNNFRSIINMNISRFSQDAFDKYIHQKYEKSCYVEYSYEDVFPMPHSDNPSIRPIVERQKIGKYDKDNVCQSREGCTCGDGYCGYLGKCVKKLCEFGNCIKDTCVCGGYNEVDDRFYSIKSNKFKDFTCVVWPEADEDDPRLTVHHYLWICEKKEGCRYRGWIFPYRSYRKGSGNTTPDSPGMLFSDYEVQFGVYDRILTPEEEKTAKDMGVVYHKADANNKRCHVWDIGSENRWLNLECRKIKPEYLCEDEFCTCGKNVCERGYACSDSYECLCSNPAGCKCGNYYVTWGMGCHERVPYCGKHPMPQKAKDKNHLSCDTELNKPSEFYWLNY